MDHIRADHALSVQLPVDPPDLSAKSARILLEILLHVREDCGDVSIDSYDPPSGRRRGGSWPVEIRFVSEGGFEPPPAVKRTRPST
jgi:hypothetical protein